MLRRLALPLLAAMLIAAGCGSSGDEQSVKNTVTSFMSALASGDGAKACSLATPQAQQKLTAQASTAGPNCQAIMVAISKRLPNEVKQGLQSAEVKKVTVNGDTATVKDTDITSKSGTLGPFLGRGSTTLKKIGGSWKIAS